MAEQARKLGARIAERRGELKLEQKDLVARMVDLGDRGINTNQVSRYEGGEGPMPRETRLEAFAGALETTVADLLAGSTAERNSSGKTPDVLATLGGVPPGLEDFLKRLERQMDEMREDVRTLLSRSQAAESEEDAADELRGSDPAPPRESDKPAEGEAEGASD